VFNDDIIVHRFRIFFAAARIYFICAQLVFYYHRIYCKLNAKYIQHSFFYLFIDIVIIIIILINK